MSDIVYYITSHGFGHATRAIEVINHIPEEYSVEIVTAVPEWLFQQSVFRTFSYHYLLHDPGIVQVHSLQQDIGATFQTWMDLLQRYPQMAKVESERILKKGAKVAIGDISPFAVLTAKEAGVKSFLVANFSWDWICQDFTKEKPEFDEIIKQFKTIYSQCDFLLRTPLSDGLDVFPNIIDIPLIVRHAERSVSDVRNELMIEKDQPCVLISFGGHGFDALKPENLEKYADIVFLTFDERFAHLSNTRLLDRKSVYHPDILNASDLVLAKLGYGIVTECIAHQKPIAYPPRYGFPEYGVLERELSHFVPMLKLDEEAFFQGRWDEIHNFLHSPTDMSQYERADTSGGETAAQNIVQHLGN